MPQEEYKNMYDLCVETKWMLISVNKQRCNIICCYGTSTFLQN